MYKRLKILEVLLENGWGGLEINACTYAANFMKRGHDVVFITAPGSRTELFCTENNIPVIPMKPALKYVDPVTALRTAVLIRKGNFDIVHAHLSKDLSTLALAKTLARRGSIVFTQGMESDYRKRDIFHRWVFNRVDMVTTVSNQVKKRTIENTPVTHRKIRCIHRGVDLEKFRPGDSTHIRKQYNIPRQARVVGLVGRLDPGKRQDLLVEAAPAVIDRCGEVYFVFVGEETLTETDSGYREKLEKMIHERNLDGRFIFTGFIEDVSTVLPMFDLTVLTTAKETFANVLIEAMACGLPVIGTNSGGTPEIIDDGKTGLLYEPDDAQKLSDCIIKLLSDAQLMRKMGRAGIKRVQSRFDFGKKLVEYEQLFYNLISPESTLS